MVIIINMGYVLILYIFVFIFQIGWRGFGRESVNSGSLRYQILNIVYPVCIVLLLFYTYIYEIVACQWKLNVLTDIEVSAKIQRCYF